MPSADSRLEILQLTLDRLPHQISEDQLRAVLNLGGLELGFYPSNRPELRDFFPEPASLRTQIFENDPQLRLLEISIDSTKLEVQQEETVGPAAVTHASLRASGCDGMCAGVLTPAVPLPLLTLVNCSSTSATVFVVTGSPDGKHGGLI